MDVSDFVSYLFLDFFTWGEDIFFFYLSFIDSSEFEGCVYLLYLSISIW